MTKPITAGMTLWEVAYGNRPSIKDPQNVAAAKILKKKQDTLSTNKKVVITAAVLFLLIGSLYAIVYVHTPAYLAATDPSIFFDNAIAFLSVGFVTLLVGSLYFYRSKSHLNEYKNKSLVVNKERLAADLKALREKEKNKGDLNTRLIEDIEAIVTVLKPHIQIQFS
jgi:hypothetical protein